MARAGRVDVKRTSANQISRPVPLQFYPEPHHQRSMAISFFWPLDFTIRYPRHF